MGRTGGKPLKTTTRVQMIFQDPFGSLDRASASARRSARARSRMGW